MKENKCNYDSYVGCNEPVIGDKFFCEKHNNIMCSVCKEKIAVGDCHYEGQFVCGYPLCENCNHNH